jgi:sec-independent protein translocase protein TatC
LLIAFIIAAVVSPTPDPVNQTICAIPLLLLYEAGILASRWCTRGREAERLAELAKRPPPPVPPPSYQLTPPLPTPTPALGATPSPSPNPTPPTDNPTGAPTNT